MNQGIEQGVRIFRRSGSPLQFALVIFLVPFVYLVIWAFDFGLTYGLAALMSALLLLFLLLPDLLFLMLHALIGIIRVDRSWIKLSPEGDVHYYSRRREIFLKRSDFIINGECLIARNDQKRLNISGYRDGRDSLLLVLKNEALLRQSI